MMGGTTATDAPADAEVVSPYFPFPYSMSPLPGQLRRGLVAPGVTGLVSALSCTTMLLFLVYRIITWRSHYKTFLGYNQYVILIANLLIADLLQGISFTFSFEWISRDGIFAPSSSCFAQGFLLNLGDLASGFFVFAIAIHTFFGAVKARHPNHKTFCFLTTLPWLLALLLSSLGPILHRDRYYVRAGAWCWVNMDYETERLALHYIWIFLVQFGVIILYALIFLHLKRTIGYIIPYAENSTHAKIDRAAKLMIMFPIAYIVLTLPLSAGRMWSAAHSGKSLPIAYALVAGSMIGSCGTMDCLLYTLTRKSLLKQNTQGTKNSSYTAQQGSWSMARTASSGVGITQTRTFTITGDRLSMISDDGMSMAPSTSQSMSTVPDRTSRPISMARSITPLSRQDTAITLAASLDPRKGGSKVEITATQVDADSAAGEDASAGTGSDAGSDTSRGIRNALGSLWKAASDRKL